MSFTVVSTFAGCGGSSLGYQMAGGKVKLAVEWDDNAVETYRLNFSNTPIYHGDITKLSVDEALDIANIRPGQLDIFDGSPPCQGFSTAGKRQFHDSRNQLFIEYVRLLNGFRPKVFVMENVSGMVKGKMKLLFAEILRALKGAGYRVSARLLNAMYFGVPQHRQRMIFVGVREDLKIEPSHPYPRVRPRTVREALGLRKGYGVYSGGFNEGEIVSFETPFPSIQAKGVGGAWREQLLEIAPEEPACADYLPAPPVTGKAKEIGFSLKPGQRGSDITKGWQDTVRLNLDKPSPTILKEGALWGRYPKVIHPYEARGLSIGELRRLASYPDDFQFAGKWVEAWARIGNSVPPLMAKAIAEHIRDEILMKLSESTGDMHDFVSRTSVA